MSIDDVKRNIERINSYLREIASVTEVYQANQILEDIEKRINSSKEILDDLNSEENSASKPLLNSIKSETKDLEICEKKYKAEVEKWNNRKLQQDLINGTLTGADALKAQRMIGLENVKEVDNQGLIIDSIAENVKGANVNLTNINAELKNQGEQMNRIQKETLETESQVKQTAKIMTKMEGRAKCIQILSFIAIIVFGLMDIFLLVFLILKLVKKKDK